MQKIEFPETNLIGLALPSKTSNENGQSNIDCGNLWQKFEAENISGKIPDKLSHDVFAVYYNYEGNYTQPFSYFIGCKVAAGTKIPDGLHGLTIPKGVFSKRTAAGKMPDCVSDAWKEIWDSGLQRAYGTDFEVYDERSKDWNNAEVDIYISVT